jgi:tRNA(Phe) wybutosine-synthesizing methylase Tyw3
MLMTAADLKNLINQVNEAFKGQFTRLSDLETKLAELEEKVNEQSKGSTLSKGRSKRVQQAKEDA